MEHKVLALCRHTDRRSFAEACLATLVDWPARRCKSAHGSSTWLPPRSSWLMKDRSG